MYSHICDRTKTNGEVVSTEKIPPLLFPDNAYHEIVYFITLRKGSAHVLGEV